MIPLDANQWWCSQPGVLCCSFTDRLQLCQQCFPTMRDNPGRAQYGSWYSQLYSSSTPCTSSVRPEQETDIKRCRTRLITGLAANLISAIHVATGPSDSLISAIATGPSDSLISAGNIGKWQLDTPCSKWTFWQYDINCSNPWNEPVSFHWPLLQQSTLMSKVSLYPDDVILCIWTCSRSIKDIHKGR